MAAKTKKCRNCGYELPEEVDIGAGQKARMGSFAATCPICNEEMNPPQPEAPAPRPGFRTAPTKPSSKRKPGAGKKRKKRKKKRR